MDDDQIAFIRRRANLAYTLISELGETIRALELKIQLDRAFDLQTTLEVAQTALWELTKLCEGQTIHEIFELQVTQEMTTERVQKQSDGA